LLRRHGLSLALAVVLIVFVWGVWSWAQFGRVAGGRLGLFTQTDFPAVTIVSRMVSEGRGAEIYSLDAQLEGQRRLIGEGYLLLGPDEELKYPYPYAPFIAVLMSPLSGIDPAVAWAVWDLINLGGMALGLWYLLASLALPGNTRLVLWLGGVTSFPFIVNLEQGQSSGVIMLALGLGIGLLKRERDLQGGLALGLLALKVQWLPFVLLALAWKRRWRALGGMALMGCALMAVTGLAAGFGWVGGYVDMLARAQRYARELLLDPWYSHSLAGGVTALLGRGTDDIARFANVAMLVGAVALVVWAWRGKWEPGAARWDAAMALTVLAAMVANPQMNTHDLCLLVVPGALGLASLMRMGAGADGGWRVVSWYGVLWGVYVSTALFLPQVFGLPVRVTTVGMVGMVGVLVWGMVESARRMNPRAT
jgi:hypothetical protein